MVPSCRFPLVSYVWAGCWKRPFAPAAAPAPRPVFERCPCHGRAVAAPSGRGARARRAVRRSPRPDAAGLSLRRAVRPQSSSSGSRSGSPRTSAGRGHCRLARGLGRRLRARGRTHPGRCAGRGASTRRSSSTPLSRPAPESRRRSCAGCGAASRRSRANPNPNRDPDPDPDRDPDLDPDPDPDPDLNLRRSARSETSCARSRRARP